MRLRTVAVTSLAAVAAASALAPAVAAPPKKPKPVTKEYVAAAFPPDPSHVVIPGTDVCDTTNPTSQHNEPFTVPFPGTLKVDMKGFQGDWDLALYSGGSMMAFSAQDVAEPLDRPESITVKLKKKGQKLQIRACNFSGGPTANVKYVFTAL